MTRQEYMKDYNIKYRQSHKGLIKYIYNHQIRNCKQRKHPLPEYTEQELYNWCLLQENYSILYEQWSLNKFDKEYTPSIDRLDNNKTYSFSNIELVTWKENKQRAYEDIRKNKLSNSGLLNNGHTPIVQYDFNGTRIQEFISISECSRQTDIDHRGISEACNGKRPTYKGFLWTYLCNEDTFVKLLTKEFLEKTKKSYESSIGYLVTIEYVDSCSVTKTIKEASVEFNITPHKIRQLAKGSISSRNKLPLNVKSMTLKLKDINC